MDFCCRGLKSDYQGLVVGRFRPGDRPYVDKDGRELTRGGGSLVVDTVMNLWPSGIVRLIISMEKIISWPMVTAVRMMEPVNYFFGK